MIFSKRVKLAKEYKEWIRERAKKSRVKIKDCPENLIAFLDRKGLINNEQK